MTVESMGWGVSRLHMPNVGYADVAAVYSADVRGWDVDVVATNVTDGAKLNAMVAEFRRTEGMA